jgi:flavodoxin I
MNKLLLIYWPEGGNVETIALKLREKLMGVDITKRTVTDVTVDDMESNDNWIIGGSTVGSHVWEDADDSNKWVEFFKMLDVVDMTKKTVAFYGLGDHILYPNHFVDGLGVFQEEFGSRNAKIVGKWPTEGYNFTDSEGVDDDMFYGLALDEDHEDELTDQRLDKWLEMIKNDFN